MKTYSRWYAAGVILIGFIMSAGANQPQTSDQIRLVKVGETMLYIPESMIASFVSGEEPKFDRTLPLTTIINARRVVQLAFDNRDFRHPNGDPNRPRPWQLGFTDVHLVDLRPGFSNLTQADFERDYVRNGNPLNTHFNCNRSYFGRDGFDYCEVQRVVLRDVWIKYRWAGRIVDPVTWPQMDLRVQKIVEWLATPPERRPAKITD
jgi:hypothetical protein